MSTSVLIVSHRTIGVHVSDFLSKLIGWTYLANRENV